MIIVILYIRFLDLIVRLYKNMNEINELSSFLIKAD